MSVLLWPFKVIWSLVSTVVVLTGRLIAVVLGVIFLVVGALLTATVIGAVIGIPLMITGLLLIARGLF